MAKLILQLTFENKEVVEPVKTVEVNLPADPNTEGYVHSLGFCIKENGQEAGSFSLTVEGMEQLVEFYRENKDKIKEKKKFFSLGDKE